MDEQRAVRVLLRDDHQPHRVGLLRPHARRYSCAAPLWPSQQHATRSASEQQRRQHNTQEQHTYSHQTVPPAGKPHRLASQRRQHTLRVTELGWAGLVGRRAAAQRQDLRTSINSTETCPVPLSSHRPATRENKASAASYSSSHATDQGIALPGPWTWSPLKCSWTSGTLPLRAPPGTILTTTHSAQAFTLLCGTATSCRCETSRQPLRHAAPALRAYCTLSAVS